MSIFGLFSQKKRRIHMDYAATTPINSRVVSEMVAVMQRYPANPGSLHRASQEVRARIEEYRSELQNLLHTQKHDIVFTRGGTEACNIAIHHALAAYRVSYPDSVPHIIVSPVEHSAIYETCLNLESRGEAKLSYAPMLESGLVDMADLLSLITSSTAIVAVQLVNSETGIIQPIKKLSHLVRRWAIDNRQAYKPAIVCDAIAGGDTIDVHAQSLGVDYLTVSSSKFYGPKSGGVLCIPRGNRVNFTGLLMGGNQEYGVRPGTEDISLIAGTVVAYRTSVEMRDSHGEQLRRLWQYAEQLIRRSLPSVIITSQFDVVSPHVFHIMIPDMDSEYAVLFLDAHGIEVASQSACSAQKGGVSRVMRELTRLRNISNPENYAYIRVSFGRSTTLRDIDTLVEALIKLSQQTYVRS